MAEDDLLVINEDLANKNTEDMKCFNNSSKDIMKDLANKDTTSGLHRKEKSITSNMEFSLAYSHHKLNFKVHWS